MTKIKIYLSRNLEFGKKKWPGGTTIFYLGFLKVKKTVDSGPIRRYC